MPAKESEPWARNMTYPSARRAPNPVADEVLGLGVVADQRRRRLLRLVLEPRVLADLDPDPGHVQQRRHGEVVLQVRAGRIPPRVPPALIRLPPQDVDQRPVRAGD